ncbi:hypothetical protein TWF730_008459 [Orbilia blumenaviensis]|uniref:Uncharacterized protein n=1 Tax=Orbilia blumenaviensis TaxID=1796055 RepID=A0AAV9V5I3_9PEZI
MSNNVDNLLRAVELYNRDLDKLIQSFYALENELKQRTYQYEEIKSSVQNTKGSISAAMIPGDKQKLPSESEDWRQALRSDRDKLCLLESETKMVTPRLSELVETSKQALAKVDGFSGVVPKIQRDGNGNDVETARNLLGKEYRDRRLKIRDGEVQVEARMGFFRDLIGEVKSEIDVILEWLKL